MKCNPSPEHFLNNLSYRYKVNIITLQLYKCYSDYVANDSLNEINYTAENNGDSNINGSSFDEIYRNQTHGNKIWLVVIYVLIKYMYYICPSIKKCITVYLVIRMYLLGLYQNENTSNFE